jgi:hypothetical protein
VTRPSPPPALEEHRFSPGDLGTTRHSGSKLYNDANKKENDARKRRRRRHQLSAGAKLSLGVQPSLTAKLREQQAEQSGAAADNRA